MPHALGAAWTKAAFFSATASSVLIAPGSLAPDVVLYQIGAPLDPTMFGVLRPAARGTGRLALQVHEHDAGVIASTQRDSFEPLQEHQE